MNHMEKCFSCALFCAIFFFILSPGVVLTLPPECKGKVFTVLKDEKCCATSYKAAAVHALVFGLVCFFICFFFNKQ